MEKLEIMELMLDKEYFNEIDKKDIHFINLFSALHHTIEKFSIDKMEFKNLLKAFKSDAVKSRYNTFDELLEYSKYSANPVGHLVLNLFEYKINNYENLFYLSDKICTGLQLINFWQDVVKDIKINRVYIPKDLMEEYKYNYESLFDLIENGNFIKLMKRLIKETEDIYFSGKNIDKILKGRLKFEIKAIYNGGYEILKQIKEKNYRVLSNDIRLSKSQKFKILIKAFF